MKMTEPCQLRTYVTEAEREQLVVEWNRSSVQPARTGVVLDHVMAEEGEEPQQWLPAFHRERQRS